MEKRRWLAISVTTDEALRGCIQENCAAICIEEPLYSEIKDCIQQFEGISDYEITVYDTQSLAILKKVHGIGAFDDVHFQIYYYLLHGW